MKVAMAYASVVLIWSTTPLATKWSATGLNFSTAMVARILIALALCSAVLAILRRPLVQHRGDWRAYFAGSIGVFPNMLLVFWSAQYIPSGLAAVIFGLTPFWVGIFSRWILQENMFNRRRVVALLVALLGLAVINLQQFSLGGRALLGVLGMLGATLCFSLSAVWVKHLGAAVDPLRQSTGTLLLAAPTLLLCWWWLDGSVPEVVDARAWYSVLYLAIAGSVVGGVLYFYVLRHCQVSSVGLITFFSPLAALAVGVLVNDERLTVYTVFGSVLILLALAIYQNVPRQLALHGRRYFLRAALPRTTET